MGHVLAFDSMVKGNMRVCLQNYRSSQVKFTPKSTPLVPFGIFQEGGKLFLLVLHLGGIAAVDGFEGF